MLMHPRRRAQPASPGRARHPDKRALCVGAVTEATRKLTLNGGADGSSVKVGRSTLTTEHRQKIFGQDGFLVRNNDLNTLETTLLSIIDLSREQIEEIKNNALTTANELFTPDKYIEQFNAFLNKCK